MGSSANTHPAHTSHCDAETIAVQRAVHDDGSSGVLVTANSTTGQRDQMYSCRAALLHRTPSLLPLCAVHRRVLSDEPAPVDTLPINLVGGAPRVADFRGIPMLATRHWHDGSDNGAFVHPSRASCQRSFEVFQGLGEGTLVRGGASGHSD